MQCILINLDSQPERREKVEHNFSEFRRDHWTLSRMSAVSTEQVRQSGTGGSLSLPEKGCFLSHLVAINASRDIPGHVMVVEDDVIFNERTFDAIDDALRLASAHTWDILFTDVCVPHIQSMVELYMLRKQLIRSGGCQLVPLDKIAFAGSAAYIVNAQSKNKLLGLLTEKNVLDCPYDLTLRQLVYAKRLQGYVAFPFPTSLSEYADSSQIQQCGGSRIADVAWNAFRRLVWLGGSPGVARENLDRIQEGYFDSECQVFSKILGCMLSSNFVSK